MNAYRALLGELLRHLPGVRNSKTLVVMEEVKETTRIHSRTKTKSPQTNGIAERFHKTMLDEFYRIAFRKKVYATLDELQADLDAWLAEYNAVRAHQGGYCYGKTPMQTFLDAAPTAREK